MILRILFCGILFLFGTACLFFSDRAEQWVVHYHNMRKRSVQASWLFLKVTSWNYRRILQVVGVFALLLFAALTFYWVEQGISSSPPPPVTQ